MRNSMLALMIMCPLLLGLAVAESADWATWRGPAGNGVSSENGWDAQAITRPSNVIWRSNVGMGHSTVAISNGRLFTMGATDTGESFGTPMQEEVIYCLDAGTGKEIWRYSYEVRRRAYPGPGATPVVDGDRVYTISRSGDLFCFAAADGRIIWRRQLLAESLTADNDWGLCGSPVINGKLLLVNAGISGIAFNKETGAVIWASEPKTPGLATPVLFDSNGKRLAAIEGHEMLYIVELSNGKVQWTYEWDSTTDPMVYAGGLLLSGAPRRAGAKLLKIDSDQPEAVWESKSMGSVFQTGVVIADHAYSFGVVRSRQPLQCVDLKTGEQSWSQDLGRWGSMSAADGKLIILDGDGDLIIAAADPGQYKELARARVLEMKDPRSYKQGEPKACWTAPVLANGKIYVRDSWGDIACVELG
jgi:outer membrane protein assembly factor BamB